MKESERIVVTSLVALLLLLWLGFFVHRDASFAGSFMGSMVGITGTVLMLVPLAYMVIKRTPPIRKAVTAVISMRTQLALHIYAGIVGPIFAVIHTGHKFNSPLGIALTTMVLLVVISGFVGRYLMSQFSQEIREKKTMLTQLEIAYRQTSGELASHPEQISVLRPWTGFWRRLAGGILIAIPTSSNPSANAPVRALRLAESIADVEYAIKTHETFKKWFSTWLKFHIVISLILYGFLALHIWASIHFGLRWFE